MSKNEVKVTADHILPWVKKRKKFTTAQLAKQFDVSMSRAAALIAILRIKGAVGPSLGKGPDGTSQWAASQWAAAA